MGPRGSSERFSKPSLTNTPVPVDWEEPNAPIIDPAPPRTVTDNGDDSYNTNEKIEIVDESYNTKDKLVDDSYNTNEKIVDVVDDSYSTNDKLVDDSYNTNDKLVDDSHSTNEKIVDQSPPVTCGTPPAAKITKEEDGESYGEAFDLREEDNTGDETTKY